MEGRFDPTNRDYLRRLALLQPGRRTAKRRSRSAGTIRSQRRGRVFAVSNQGDRPAYPDRAIRIRRPVGLGTKQSARALRLQRQTGMTLYS